MALIRCSTVVTEIRKLFLKQSPPTCGVHSIFDSMLWLRLVTLAQITNGTTTKKLDLKAERTPKLVEFVSGTFFLILATTLLAELNYYRI